MCNRIRPPCLLRASVLGHVCPFKYLLLRNSIQISPRFSHSKAETAQGSQPSEGWLSSGVATNSTGHIVSEHACSKSEVLHPHGGQFTPQNRLAVKNQYTPVPRTFLTLCQASRVPCLTAEGPLPGTRGRSCRDIIYVSTSGNTAWGQCTQM